VPYDPSALASLIRDIPDFPKPGIMFKDITPLLGDGPAWVATIEQLAALPTDGPIDRVVGIEARGFLLGAAVAFHLGVGFVPLRKPSKLPYRTNSVSYSLEYGSESLEMHVDAVGPGDGVLIVDDVLATGGTAAAAVQLLRGAGATVVGASFLMELSFLDGRAQLPDVSVASLLTY